MFYLCFTPSGELITKHFTMATTFHFYLRKDKQKKNGEYPIYLRITSNRKHKYVSTGLSIKGKHWNENREIIRGSHHNHKALNKILKDKIIEAERAYSDVHTGGKVSASEIKQRIIHQENSDFFSFADDYIKELKEKKKYYGRKAAKVAFNKLEKFQGERYLPFNEITPEYIEEFISYLELKHDNVASTIRKNLQPIRRIVKRALKARIITTDPFTIVDLPSINQSPKKTKLKFEQIKAIENLKLTPKTWNWNTRNAFLFSFYSGGIRFGDICCLTWQNVKNDRLAYKMSKNDKEFSTALNDYQKEILEIYSGAGDEFIFPFLKSGKDYSDPAKLRASISSKNVLANRSLKKIVKKINRKIDDGELSIPKIDKSVSFHVSRHSFAQHAVESGLSVYELMQTLRHSKVETTQQYLKGLDEELADKAMKKVF